MVKAFDNEKIDRLDIPDRSEKKVKRKLKVKDVHRSIPEMLMIGLAIGLKIVGAITLAVAAVAVVVGGFGLWGKLRKDSK